MKKVLISYFIIIFIFIFFINFIQFYQSSPNVYSESLTPNYFFSENSDFSWPIPGFHNITSSFGSRIHPITKKESSHQGIDVSAPPGTNLYSVCDGVVVLAEYDGANGYSLHIASNNLVFIYGHISPQYLVSLGEVVSQNQIIAQVGPKYIDGKLNGSTTGPHLHFGIKKDGIAVNPLDFF